jgi:hypothetical protein
VTVLDSRTRKVDVRIKPKFLLAALDVIVAKFSTISVHGFVNCEYTSLMAIEKDIRRQVLALLDSGAPFGHI